MDASERLSAARVSGASLGGRRSCRSGVLQVLQGTASDWQPLAHERDLALLQQHSRMDAHESTLAEGPVEQSTAGASVELT